jgi:hypothetical protein
LQIAEEPAARGLSSVKRFLVSGVIWKVTTNSPEMLSTLEALSEPVRDETVATCLELFLSVDPGSSRRDPEFRPYFRALDHLFFAGFGPGDTLLIDQRRCRVVGTIGPDTACDLDYWGRIILPCMAGITSACTGVAPVHCACVVRNGQGLLIHGRSGAGKSTLALALSLNGFSYLSDDCTYVSDALRLLKCWGSTAPLKLIPDSRKFFPELADLEPGESMNGELAYQIDPTSVFGVTKISTCEPRWILFIERIPQSVPTFRAVNRADAASWLASDLELLPPSLSDQRHRQLAVIDRLAARQGWVLRHALPPVELAATISQFCDSN